MAVSRIPPAKVRSNAAKGLDIRSKQSPSNKAMVGEDGKPSKGVFTARALISGKPISKELLQTMVAWFARHDASIKERRNRADRNSKAYQAFLAWGGNEGRAWAKKTLRRIAQEEKKND
tara:strand:+ start:238 stop:594 length:357 start_codon:yes stop_codon:yes gene_type:complete